MPSTRPTSRTAPLAVRLAAAPATAAVVLAGLWVTGGLISNDFRVAMALTAAWMALCGATALVIAVRSRAFRRPVLAAYVLTAAVAGVYLGASVVADALFRSSCAAWISPKLTLTADRLSKASVSCTSSCRRCAIPISTVRNESAMRHSRRNTAS